MAWVWSLVMWNQYLLCLSAQPKINKWINKMLLLWGKKLRPVDAAVLLFKTIQLLGIYITDHLWNSSHIWWLCLNDHLTSSVLTWAVIISLVFSCRIIFIPLYVIYLQVFFCYSWKYHGQGSLAGYSPWGHKESDITECACTHTHTHTHTLILNHTWSLI